MSNALQRYFADYAAFHATPGNRTCHMVGIPLIVFTLFALLTQVPLFALGGFTVTLAEVLLLVASVFYLTLDLTLALLMLAVSLGFLVFARRTPFAWALSAFVLGWILQFVGHYVYEKKAPAFLGNLAHLLVGPLWILAKLTGRA